MKKICFPFAALSKKWISIASILALIAWSVWPERIDSKALSPPRLAPLLAGSCLGVEQYDATYQQSAIRESGLYCVKKNVWQRRFSGSGHSGPGTYHVLVEIFKGNVTIDLQNHTLHSDGHSGGIKAVVRSDLNSAESSSRIPILAISNITIKNGVIDLRGLGTGIEFIRHWDPMDVHDPIPKGRTDYDKSRFILENLLIKTDNMGIALEGDGNIVRDCVIESGGNAAIMMSGPNGRITNNTIVLANPFVPAWMAGAMEGPLQTRHILEFIKSKKLPRAAIILRQASGTVVSGNRIEVVGESDTRHPIYARYASQAIVINDNTFIGTVNPVILMDGSSAKLSDNRIVKPKGNWLSF